MSCSSSINQIDMYTRIQDLPSVALENILKNLSFDEIMVLRNMSSSLREACIKRFRVGFFNLATKLQKNLEKSGNLMKNLFELIGEYIQLYQYKSFV